jgi:hypothetical protein
MEEAIIAKVCDGIIYEFVRNSKGTLIKKCCASCKHKQPYDSEGQRRLCCKGKNTEKKVVYNYNVCNDWAINPDIDKIKTIQSQPMNNENNN